MSEEAIEAAARAVASALGDSYDDAFANKSEWIAERGQSGGRFRDVNEPFRCDYDEAATAAIAAYRAARKEAGFVEVHLGELERAGVVLTARPQNEGE